MPAILWAFVIMATSILPGDAFPDIDIRFFDKIVHFTKYAILAILMVSGVNYSYKYYTPLKKVLFMLILAGGYGILMELVQWFIPNRVPSIWDVVANVAGILTGMMVMKGRIWQK